LIKECLKDGDQIYFEIQSLDLWLSTSINLHLANEKIISCKAQFKFPKNATVLDLKKSLQVFAIKLWCHKNSSPDGNASKFDESEIHDQNTSEVNKDSVVVMGLQKLIEEHE
jgi:hypothetical protein